MEDYVIQNTPALEVDAWYGYAWSKKTIADRDFTTLFEYLMRSVQDACVQAVSKFTLLRKDLPPKKKEDAVMHMLGDKWITKKYTARVYNQVQYVSPVLKQIYELSKISYLL